MTEEQAGILTAKAKRIGQGGPHPRGHRRRAHHGQRTRWIGGLKVRCAGYDLALDGKQASRRLDGARCCHQVAHGAFDGRDRNVIRRVAQGRVQGLRFGWIVERCAGSMGIDVVNLRRRDPRTPQRLPNRQGLGCAIWTRGRDPVGILAAAPPAEPRQHRLASGLCRAQILDDKERGPLANDQAIALEVKRTTM